MRINSIRINKLFEIFDYDISFNSNENILIITGPNGFGKTMVLNIIYSLFNRRFIFFQQLVFSQITIFLDDKFVIIIDKIIENDDKSSTQFHFFQDGEIVEEFHFSNKTEIDIERSIQRYLPVRRVDQDKWIDNRSGRLLSMEELINEYADQLPEEVSKNVWRIKSDKANKILDSIQVHLIKEQRLFKKVQSADRSYRAEKEEAIMIETIQTYSKELKQLISEFSQRSFFQTQELDSSYPNRLRSETNILSEDEYERRYNTLKSKQKKLTEFGLYESKQEFLTYSQEDAKALSVYLKDFELKLGVFDALLEKLELFTNILNERRFTFKSIFVNRNNGFYFKTIKGKELELNQLSSGEQHEVVLLYELIFNVRTNVLVLIDEPEISLHITWQKEFLNDLLKIIKIQNIQVLIATHSPSIIDDRWDLVYNLKTEY
ncbi:AAA family ATPase [Mucilaginibacter sp. X5P1]|uniref:AAA family ATPase n=1 Tax=Mucilaginibacter sp. X5P1 TaxID=2723088 RepID=UPI0016116DD1|nr:AAA family ATPase [Mucilaginibacter sp. X5P1]MBB6141968.1 putative ATP-binding protein involved in virulence [Mucilaginibacter sp. X5P1]